MTSKMLSVPSVIYRPLRHFVLGGELSELCKKGLAYKIDCFRKEHMQLNFSRSKAQSDEGFACTGPSCETNQRRDPSADVPSSNDCVEHFIAHSRGGSWLTRDFTGSIALDASFYLIRLMASCR